MPTHASTNNARYGEGPRVLTRRRKRHEDGRTKNGVTKYTTRAAANGDTSGLPSQRDHRPSNRHENHPPLPLYRPSTRKEIWEHNKHTMSLRRHEEQEAANTAGRSMV